MSKFDTRKVRRMPPRDRYGELYFYWREAEQMIASNLPDARRQGRRLKRRVENLYSESFGQLGHAVATSSGLQAQA